MRNSKEERRETHPTPEASVRGQAPMTQAAIDAISLTIYRPKVPE
jgi:hypothetical protein